MEKNIYETPMIEDHGSFEELTAGQSEGESTDKLFPHAHSQKAPHFLHAVRFRRRF